MTLLVAVDAMRNEQLIAHAEKADESRNNG